MRLVIAEKPSVAMSIAAVLGVKDREEGCISGKEYIVSWCYGHLAELADPAVYDERYAKWRLEDLPILPGEFQYTLRPDGKNQFEVLRALMDREDVTEVINACDAGREGELIFRTVYHLAGCTKPILRLWVSSMEDSAIRDGFRSLWPGSEYDGLYQSALCRAKADWLVGINATRYFSLLYGLTLNVGRVVSPTLALLVQREAEIAAFETEPFYTVQLDCGFPAATERMKEKAEAKQIADSCQGIIAPTPFEKKVEEVKLDPDTKAPLLDKDGNAIIEEKEINIPMFKPVKVFDVSQTDGRPLPQLAASLYGNVQQYEIFVEALRRSALVPITFQALAQNMDGFFSHKDQSITIREGMSEVQTISALVHEIAHSKLHNPALAEDKPQWKIIMVSEGGTEKDYLSGFASEAEAEDRAEQDGWRYLDENEFEWRLEVVEDTEAVKAVERDRRTEEVEAESVSYAVCQYYGIPEELPVCQHAHGGAEQRGDLQFD